MAEPVSTDPNLSAATKEIQEVLQRRHLAGCFQLASSIGAEFSVVIPDWSAIHLVELGGHDEYNHGVRIRSDIEKHGPNHIHSSAHLYFALRDMLAEHFQLFDHTSKVIEQALNQGGVTVTRIEDEEVKKEDLI